MSQGRVYTCSPFKNRFDDMTATKPTVTGQDLIAPNRSAVEQARFNMIEQQIRPWDVLDTGVLDLLASVHREDYVPIRYRGLAFVDTTVPLGFGEFMWPPRVEGRCLQALELRPADRVLEVGSGSGYLTALIAHQAADVTSYEIHPELARRARNAMINNGIGNADVREACGLAALAAPGARFDVVVLTGSVPLLPDSWFEALEEGGRLFAVVGGAPAMHARLYRKTNGVATAETLFETELAPLQNAPRASGFVF